MTSLSISTVWNLSVSIPHRYGKNRNMTAVLALASEFPFLIGTVRTRLLIGWYSCRDSFPFLIGTVRTHSLSVVQKMEAQVSIPHRYGKNEVIRHYSYFSFTEFPFLIGTVRTETTDRHAHKKDSGFHSS